MSILRIATAAFLAAVLADCALAAEKPPLTEWWTNYASIDNGATITSPCRLLSRSEIEGVIGGKDFPNGRDSIGVIFADNCKQHEEFTIDLGRTRKLGVMTIECDLPRRAPGRLKIDVAETSADGPWKTVCDIKPIYHLHEVYLDEVPVRWIHVDLGESTGKRGSRIRRLKVFPRYRLKAAAEVIHELAPHYRRDVPELAAFWKAYDARRWDEACDELIRRYAARVEPLKAEFKGAKPSERTQNWMENRVVDGGYTFQFASSDWDWQAHYLGAPVGGLGLIPGAYSIFNDMANACLATGEEKYSRKSAELLTDWLQDNPYPGWDFDSDGDMIEAWGGLKASGRCSVLATKCLPTFCADNLAFTRDLKVNLINSVWQHMNQLDRIRVHLGGNWLTNVNSSLFGCAILFPEFVEQKQWLADSLESLEQTFARDVFPCGREVEDSTMYVPIASGHLTRQYEAVRKAGLKLSDEAERKMSRLWDACAWVGYPDTSAPSIGDCGRRAVLRKFGGAVPKEYLALFDRPDLVYINSQGKEGKAPAQTSRSFDGWYVMRSAWEERPYEDARQMFFKCSTNRTHGHLDQLQALVYAYGRELLTDPGMTAYGLPSNAEARSTAFHNTVCVNETDQQDAEGQEHAWAPGKGADFVDASFHCGTVIYRRQIVFLKSGEGLPDYWLVGDRFHGRAVEHTFDQNWHLSVEADPVVSGKSAMSGCKEGGNLLIYGTQAGPTPTIEDYWVAGEIEKNPAKRIRYRMKTVPCARFDTFLVPYKGTKAPDFEATALQPDAKDDAKTYSAFSVKTQAGTDIVSLCVEPAGNRSFNGADLVTDAQALILRYDKRGKLIYAFQYGGSQTTHRGRQVIKLASGETLAEQIQ